MEFLSRQSNKSFVLEFAAFASWNFSLDVKIYFAKWSWIFRKHIFALRRLQKRLQLETKGRKLSETWTNISTKIHFPASMHSRCFKAVDEAIKRDFICERSWILKDIKFRSKSNLFSIIQDSIFHFVSWSQIPRISRSISDWTLRHYGTLRFTAVYIYNRRR